MKTPDEIKKGLEYCTSDVICKHCPYDAICREMRDKANVCPGTTLMEDALAYIHQLEAQVPRWISTKERQPDENDIGMLVVVSGKPRDNIIFDDAIVIGFYYVREGWVIEGWEEWENPTVTYWMPLPKPPKEE